MRRSVVWLVAALVVTLVAAAVVWVVIFVRGPQGTSSAECSVPAVPGPDVTVVVEGPQTTGAGAAGQAELGASATASTEIVTAPAVSLTAVQLQHASTINAIGLSRELPERARIIAVATAWQESGLRNLPGGDRDSVGLFQQRPSQGWGTVAQVGDPVYASNAFYDALEQVDGWESMSLTAAAQAVQYSGYPDAYAKWEPTATTLVRELSGAADLALSCRAGAQGPSPVTATRTAVSGAAEANAALGLLLADAQAELGGLTVVSATGGAAVLSAQVPGLSDTDAARALAGWLVAHAAGDGVADVTVAARRWTTAGWAATDAPAAPGRVSLTLTG
ncbi:hypothetical protein GIS00_03105 [Nakamurella sp. YIM 132087]|uniref:Heavy metal transporter n=1 Tax=Nakamurella alba TaxID=2665158 RepID=A0A7K1FI26_9ACTN|nr:hypothetical protein [Nakamurella alba]MTD12933.1 hypothetical protein [Nakamurella alba]